MPTSPPHYSVVDKIGQSPRLTSSQLSEPVTDTTFLKDKTVLITGGASGFGAGFLRRWAAAGATVIIGDISVEKGSSLVRDVAKETGNPNLHFFHCDVRDWQSQVTFFKNAVKVSPHGGIDVVVANAGIAGEETIDMPKGIDAAEPPPPSLKVLDVNLIGVLYTAHLALWYLPRNPGSAPASKDADPAQTPSRDRHLILMSSMAGLGPIPTQTLYATSKHGVVGLYRNLRASSFMHGVRTNLICPYFMDTPIVTVGARVLLAGAVMGKPEAVVEAGTKFAADPRIVGRAVAVGAKVKCRREEDGQWVLVEKGDPNQEGEELSSHEICAGDFEDVELFTKNMIGIMNLAAKLRGWAGYFGDIVKAIRYGIGL